jgi:hypothetical protein
MHCMEALEELGERLNYKLNCHKDEKIWSLPQDNQEALVEPPFKIFICKNDIGIWYDHIELWYDHISLFVIEPCCLMWQMLVRWIALICYVWVGIFFRSLLSNLVLIQTQTSVLLDKPPWRQQHWVAPAKMLSIKKNMHSTRDGKPKVLQAKRFLLWEFYANH